MKREMRSGPLHISPRLHGDLRSVRSRRTDANRLVVDGEDCPSRPRRIDADALLAASTCFAFMSDTAEDEPGVELRPQPALGHQPVSLADRIPDGRRPHLERREDRDLIVVAIPEEAENVHTQHSGRSRGLTIDQPFRGS